MEGFQRELGEYRLLSRLATGGQSEVFLAARSGPHGFFRPVVIKAIPEEFKGELRLEALFYQEATISSRFIHPHVVTIHDARRVGDEDFMVMDYVPGQTVADLAQRAFSEGDGLSRAEALLVIIDACRGLEYVHSFEDVDQLRYEIVHCDISPQNLMVTYSGLTKVFDFGIAQILGESGKLKSDLVGGKFAYMSPEQCLGENVDPRSDIFSLGIILYELVTGRRLFRRGEREESLRAITEEPILRPSELGVEISPHLEEVIMKALAREREERFSNARALRKSLEEALADEGPVGQDGLRAALGRKVASLFEKERKEVAETLQRARQELSEQVFAPKTATTPVETQSPGLEGELEEVKRELIEMESRARRATEVAGRLTEEVTRLQAHQRWFVAAICGLAMLAVGIAALAYVSGEPPSPEATAMAEE